MITPQYCIWCGKEIIPPETECNCPEKAQASTVMSPSGVPCSTNAYSTPQGISDSDLSEAIKDMELAINCLWIEVPESIVNDIKAKWDKIKSLI